MTIQMSTLYVENWRNWLKIYAGQTHVPVTPAEFAEILSTMDDLFRQSTTTDGVPQGVREAALRARRAGQILVDEIGAEGPEDVVQTATRAVHLIRSLRKAEPEEYSRGMVHAAIADAAAAAATGAKATEAIVEVRRAYYQEAASVREAWERENQRANEAEAKLKAAEASCRAMQGQSANHTRTEMERDYVVAMLDRLVMACDNGDLEYDHVQPFIEKCYQAVKVCDLALPTLMIDRSLREAEQKIRQLQDEMAEAKSEVQADEACYDAHLSVMKHERDEALKELREAKDRISEFEFDDDAYDELQERFMNLEATLRKVTAERDEGEMRIAKLMAVRDPQPAIETLAANLTRVSERVHDFEKRYDELANKCREVMDHRDHLLERIRKAEEFMISYPGIWETEPVGGHRSLEGAMGDICAGLAFWKSNSQECIESTFDAKRNTDQYVAEIERLREALAKISDIRDSIVGMQGFNFSEHAYPLVAALDSVGFTGAGYQIARKNLGTVIDQRDALQRELAGLKERARAVALLADPGDEALRTDSPALYEALLSLCDVLGIVKPPATPNPRWRQQRELAALAGKYVEALNKMAEVHGSYDKIECLATISQCRALAREALGLQPWDE